MFYMTHKMAISYHSWNWWQFDPVMNEHLERIKNKKNKVELPLQPNSKWNHSTNWRQSTWWDSQKSEKSNVLLHHNGLYSWHQSHWTTFCWLAVPLSRHRLVHQSRIILLDLLMFKTQLEKVRVTHSWRSWTSSTWALQTAVDNPMIMEVTWWDTDKVFKQEDCNSMRRHYVSHAAVTPSIWL